MPKARIGTDSLVSCEAPDGSEVPDIIRHTFPFKTHPHKAADLMVLQDRDRGHYLGKVAILDLAAFASESPNIVGDRARVGYRPLSRIAGIERLSALRRNTRFL